MSSNNPVADFFDARASRWDEWAEDDLGFVRTLFDRIGIQKGDKVLDLACGTGVVTALLHEYSGAPVVGMDIAPKMIEIAKKKYENSDFATFVSQNFMSYEGDPFDVIVLYNAYPHFLDPKGLAEKLHSSLKSGGRFAIVHSLGRQRLAKHHEGLSIKISRDLAPVEIEAESFKERFEITVAEEGEDFSLIIGKVL